MANATSCAEFEIGPPSRRDIDKWPPTPGFRNLECGTFPCTDCIETAGLLSRSVRFARHLLTYNRVHLKKTILYLPLCTQTMALLSKLQLPETGPGASADARRTIAGGHVRGAAPQRRTGSRRNTVLLVRFCPRNCTATHAADLGELRFAGTGGKMLGNWVRIECGIWSR